MTAEKAKVIARKWVHEHAREVPGLQGVIFGGSVNVWPDTAEYDPLSDIDLWHLVSEDVSSTVRQRKLMYEGVLLEPAYLGYRAFQDAETVLASWVFAGHLAVPSVIFDPAGRLLSVQKTVAVEYAKPARIRQRCNAIESELNTTWFPRLSTGTSLVDRMFAFGYVVTTLQQLPLIASLKLPTIRRSGMLFTQMLSAAGQKRLSEKRLELLGSAGLSRDCVENLLDSCVAVYDRALEVHRKPTPFDYDLSPEARSFAIGGSRDLIDRGYHREALLWILFLHWVAYVALEQEALEECARSFKPAFDTLAQTVGVLTIPAAEEKARLAAEVLTETRKVAETMIEAHAAGLPEYS